MARILPLLSFLLLISAGYCSRSGTCSFVCRGLLAQCPAQLSHAKRHPRPPAPWESNHLNGRRRSRLRVLPGEGVAPGHKDGPAFHPDRLRRCAPPARRLRFDPFLLRRAPGDPLPPLRRRLLRKGRRYQEHPRRVRGPGHRRRGQSLRHLARVHGGLCHRQPRLWWGTPKQAYTITSVKKMSTPGSELVACHGMKYTYAVFHCHTTTAAAYTVSMAGADGTRVEALAACHTDSAAGVEEAFKKLNVKPGTVPVCHFLPGTVPVCHFLPQDDLLWSRN